MEPKRDQRDIRAQRWVLKISFSSCIMGNSTHTETMKAAAYERTTEPVKKKDCGEKRENTNNPLVNRS